MIKVEGYSGCRISVFCDAEGCYVLEKSTDDPKYVPRLLRQAEKQVAFTKLNKVRSVVAPKVLHRRLTSVEAFGDDGGLERADNASASIGMRFEHHTDAITFLHRADVHCVERFSCVLVEVLQQYVDHSPLVDVPRSIFDDKLADVARIIAVNEHVAEVDRSFLVQTVTPALRESLADTLHIPVGLCHGDLTLSNILFRGHVAPTPHTPDEELRRRAMASSGGEWVILIDFLDNFVESPLADLAKLEQDLRFGWTLKLHAGDHFDTVKIFTVLANIRSRLLAHFGACEWFVQYFQLFFIINQLRVVQYAKSECISSYLVATIREVFGEWQLRR